MDWKAEAIQKLRGYEANKHRLGAALAEQGEKPTPICTGLEALYIRRAKGNVARLQEVFSISKSQVYQRRDKALGAFITALYGVDIAKGPPR